MNDTREIEIALRLFEYGLDGDNYAEVFDGEETVEAKLTNPTDILSEATATEISWVHFYNPSGGHLGGFLLIWGNHDDLISDHTDNPWCRTVFDKVSATLGLI